MIGKRSGDEESRHVDSVEQGRQIIRNEAIERRTSLITDLDYRVDDDDVNRNSNTPYC